MGFSIAGRVNKRWWIGCMLLAVLAWVPLLQATAALVPSPPQLQARAWILMDADTGRVLAQHEADMPLPPASLTKIMTDFLLAAELDAGRVSLDDRVPISEKAWRTGGSKMFVHVGDQVRVEDLARGIVIQSGNDASVAIAEYLAGTEAAFAEMMTQQARELGMDSTVYKNATGLPHQEMVTTARDQALLARAMIERYPEHYALYSEREFTYGTDFQTGEPITQRNRNALLWMDQTVDGMKTGHTAAAGYCLVASARRDGMRLISVVLGADSARGRARDSQALLRYGFRFFDTRTLYSKDQELERVQVWQGQADEVTLGLAEDVTMTLARGRFDQLAAEVALDARVRAPIEKGDPLGELTLMLGDETVFQGPVVALEPVDRAGFFKRVWHALQLFFMQLFG